MTKTPRSWLTAFASVLVLAGCNDSTRPRDHEPPAAPRGLYSVTGDRSVTLDWLENTESDVVGYRVYEAPCDGPSCPYDEIAYTTRSNYTVPGLSNGVTRFFAVTAIDQAGNESDLSEDEVFDTPRPAGFGRSLANYLVTPATSGYDFSAGVVRPFDDASTDIYFGSNAGVSLMYTPFEDTDIQDAGYATSLDVIDFAPGAGWSPTGSVELIVGHCYFVWTHDDHYAKFRVTSLSSSQVEIDWAYQTDPGNRELRAKRVGEGRRVRRVFSPVP